MRTAGSQLCRPHQRRHGLINKHGMIQPNAPFGGVRQSGIGVQFGTAGLRECTNVKTIIR